MKHVRQIVVIALVLQEVTKWNVDKIHSFIMKISDYEAQMRKFNEVLMNGVPDKKTNPAAYIEACGTINKRIECQQAAFNYLHKQGFTQEEFSFSHNVMDCPIKFDFGVDYTNCEDNKSFVINL